ncbi:helix-turn-helix domain-containing protein [Listeria monocytogenes]|uniref:helix-turn-helix domain-containing protein n=1 Tax=Bacilli TaxID=91061 RepID=UPI00083DE64A|nr:MULTISPECIES: helix-turn-helix domain-containing protein [Bacilli]EAC3952700.1 helix-turn-helix domain-containing protein [Listeria monocytogenes]EAC3952953.1 helix-turn-helix domain-containing protein [Listeria monocytogenes]EAC7426774.1 helix-turn-helix domain-containing protein [Listeria monocytogenes]EAC7427213.1 helix-turn-helix domain-containing protein [Listeria monocytogenes]EAD1751329.1 helix-turn-helix domain-containing protein [Listeria monocytogenes]
MKNSQEVLPFPIIALAVNGDVNAVNHVLKHFEHYIIKLSQKTLFDEMGNPHIHVEPEIKRILETKLIVAMMNFDLM